MHERKNDVPGNLQLYKRIVLLHLNLKIGITKEIFFI